MERTLNQLMRELQEIANQHRQINGSFFQGDFYDAISRDAVQYPLMVVTLQPGSINDTSVTINAVVTICDKYNKQEYRQINEVHSDCLSILNDINVTMRQYRFTEFMDLATNLATDPFIEQGHDVVAGWTMALQCNIFNESDWCTIPYDNYDFENGIPSPSGCGDLFTTFEVYVNSVLVDTFTQSTETNNTININL
jgi:hypothetical protein